MRYILYGILKPILIELKIYYYIIIDFIIALPIFINGYNYLIIIIYKFSKVVITVLRKDIFNAEE